MLQDSAKLAEIVQAKRSVKEERHKVGDDKGQQVSYA